METTLLFSIILLVLLAMIVCLIIAKLQSKHYFRCNHCGRRFQPKWTQMIFETHTLKEHKIKCLYCNVKDDCTDEGKR